MLSGRCFKDGCANRLHGKCECDGIILFCKKHSFEHLEKSSSKGHQLIRLFPKPTEEINYPIIKKLKELKKDIKKYKIEAIKNANKIIKNFNSAFEKYVCQINEAEARCNKMLKIIYSDFDLATEGEIESVLKLNISDAQREMAGWDIKECYLDYKDINVAIRNTYEIPFNPFRKPLEDVIESSELSYFMHNTSDFATINLENFQISSKVTLPTQEPIHGYTRSCILPDHSYFYCCSPNNRSGLTFIIDKNKNVKLLRKSKNNYLADPIFFFNNFIYLIGG
ncbi:unnamed protein product [Blepharisma stoltei]|uniref:Uncharacterized protein n=1 Tax=Blepharisma stoltei TaxID=1481888 RepID=A0AAU9K5B4_9CILI|nr:unnamed protein product [Blepharisma stoltei]